MHLPANNNGLIRNADFLSGFNVRINSVFHYQYPTFRITTTGILYIHTQYNFLTILFYYGRYISTGNTHPCFARR